MLNIAGVLNIELRYYKRSIVEGTFRGIIVAEVMEWHKRKEDLALAFGCDCNAVMLE